MQSKIIAYLYPAIGL